MVISIQDKSKQNKMIADSIKNSNRSVPEYLELNEAEMSGKLLSSADPWVDPNAARNQRANGVRLHRPQGVKDPQFRIGCFINAPFWGVFFCPMQKPFH